METAIIETRADPAISALSECVSYSWSPKVTDGFFFRAETFNTFVQNPRPHGLRKKGR